MAKNKIEVDVVVDDKGSTKKASLQAKNLGESLDKTSKSSRTATKNIKGVAGTASAGGKNFSKMAQGITGGIVPAYAVLAANIFAVTAAFGFLKRAADLAELKESQLEFAASTGQGMAQITASLRDASNGMLGFREAAEAAAIGSAKGFSPEMMEKLAIGATKASKALGRDFADSFDRLVRGVSKAEPELLDELGITLRLETASKNYAKQLGLQRDELTASQRSMAVYLEVQKQLDSQYGSIEGAENPYQKLAKTFQEIVDKITEQVLPAFNMFANMIADNAGIAMIFFTSIGLSIAKTFPMFDGAGAKFDAWEMETEAGLLNMKHDYDTYIDKLKDTEEAIESLARAEADSQSKAKESAKGVVNDPEAKIKGRKGSGLSILQQGGTPSKRQLNAMLKSAKNNTGEYKKLSEQKRKQFINDLEKMMKKENKFVTWSKKKWNTMKKVTGKVIRFLGNDWTKTMKRMELRTAKMVKKVARSFKWMGKQINKVAKKLPFIGLFLMIQNGMQKLLDMPFDALMGIVDFGMRSLQTILNIVDGAIKGLKTLINMIPGFGKKLDDTVGLKKDWLITEEDIENAKEGVEKGAFGQSLLKRQESNIRASGIDDALDEIRDASKELRKDLEATSRAYSNLISGKGPDGEELSPAQVAKNLTEAARIKAKALTTSNVGGQLDTGIAGFSVATKGLEGAELTDAAKVANKKFLKGFKKELDDTDFKKLFEPLYTEMFPGGDDLTGLTIQGVQDIFKGSQGASENWLSNIKDTKEAITSITESFSGKNLHEANAQLLVFENLIRVFEKTKDLDPTHVNPFKKELNAIFGMDENGEPLIAEYKKNLENMITERQSILEGKGAVDIQSLDAAQNLSGSSLKNKQELLAVLMAELNLRQANLDVQIAEEALRQGVITEVPEAKLAALRDAEAAAKRVGVTTVQALDDSNAKLDDMKQSGLKIGASLESSMSAAFASIVTGAKSAKQAFADMAKSMLTMIAKLITELVVAAALKAALGGTTFGNWLGIEGKRDGGIAKPPGLRYGGIAKSKYAAGGIASGRDAGYPAMLHGTEAVVPLPNNRSIPVDLKGAGGQNNVTINVSMDNSGNKSESSSDSMMGENLGQAISMAVQEELQYQKRSGGILNPYGVS
jgi:hypothetical protein